ncbi:MAG: ArsA family ATPase [Myxococcaceae bacterium]|nr:ArsA family ATPase [Myxococcaceae bacterium]MCI0669945.1 ArsA family ATPase [Myxococcaceae bacterium]
MSGAGEPGSGVLARALAARRVVVCVGAGGVGKTTVSASLALEAALKGRESLVCTIDPAKRLANALGLSALGNVEARIPDPVWSDAGLTPRAPLHAMMLDMKRTWDELIARYAPADVRERIFANRFYQALSSALAGSQEYIAMEKLWELRSSRGYPLIVLDTPPTAHALDFLDAPNRVLDFLDNDAARWLLTPALRAGKMGLKFFNLGGSFVMKQLSRLTGTETLQELANFMLAMSALNEDFRERARAVKALLRDTQTAFVLVTGAAVDRQDEAIHFHSILTANGMAPVAVVVNRVHTAPTAEDFDRARALPSPLQEKVLRTLEERATLAARDALGIAELQRQVGNTPLVQVPRFEQDVHDVRALAETARYLVGEASVSV